MPQSFAVIVEPNEAHGSAIAVRFESIDRKAHTVHQIVESRIGLERIQARIDFQVRQPLAVCLICLFKPGKGIVFISQSGIDQRNFIATDFIFADMPDQLGDDRVRLAHVALSRICVAEMTETMGRIAPFQKLIDRFFVQSLLR